MMSESVLAESSPPNEKAVPDTVASTCLNCGAEVSDRYCGKCGQERGEPIPHLRELSFELLDEFLKFDSKIARTAIILMRHPGQLTLEYASGRKMSYVAPFKLYFWCSFLFYLAVPFSDWMNTSQFNIHFKDPILQRGVTSGIEFYFGHLASFSIVFLPLGAIVIALVSRKAAKPFLYHLVGVLHVYSAGFIISVFIIIACGMLSRITHIDAINASGKYLYMIAVAIYQMLAFKVMYASRWGSAIFKSLLTLFVALLTSVLMLYGCIAFYIYKELKQPHPAARVSSPGATPAK